MQVAHILKGQMLGSARTSPLHHCTLSSSEDARSRWARYVGMSVLCSDHHSTEEGHAQLDQAGVLLLSHYLARCSIAVRSAKRSAYTQHFQAPTALINSKQSPSRSRWTSSCRCPQFDVGFKINSLRTILRPA